MASAERGLEALGRKNALGRPPGGERSTISSRVFVALRKAIITLEIKPGDSLSEADVSRRLGVSRQPVREAFIKLAETGLVEILPQRGTFVGKISIEEVRNAQFVREAIEAAIVRRAAEAASTADVARIAAVIEDQQAAMKRGDQVGFLELDEAFHSQIAQAAGCTLARRTIESVKPQLDRVRFLSLPLAKHMRNIMDWHRKILKAIEAHEPDEAEAAMRQHVGEFITYLPKIAEAYPDLFELPEDV